jgi:hypothetical protein
MTQSEALALFEYRDGQLYWRVKPSRGVNVGNQVGYVHPTGHRRFMYRRKGYAIHRIIWLMHYGDNPSEIDHKDTDKLNNHVENLRIANRKNQQNVGFRGDNTSGAKNVYWFKPAQRWSVIVTANKVRHNLGYFEDFELADLVATEARNKYHGEFANHGH